MPIKVFCFNSYRIKFFKQDKQGQNCKASGKRFKCWEVDGAWMEIEDTVPNTPYRPSSQTHLSSQSFEPSKVYCITKVVQILNYR